MTPADSSTRSKPKSARGGDSRRGELLEAAARLFASRSYKGTSVRDIATAVGMLPGSIYYHFKSKEELLVAVHEQGVNHVKLAVEQAVNNAGDEPWQRLTAAAVAHLDALLGDNPFSQVVTPEFTRGFDEPLRSTLIAQRDGYEAMFERLVERLPVPKGTNRRMLRLALLGSLNWSLTWYRPGGRTPASIAREMIELYRKQLDPSL